MTDSNLKAKAEAATAGPWKKYPEGSTIYLSQTKKEWRSYHMALTTFGPQDYKELKAREKADAEYIAAANPATVLALISQIDQLQSELTALKAQVDGAFNEGVEAAIACINKSENIASKEWLAGARLLQREAINIRKLSRPTKSTEAKDGSHE